jgi:hypothetical protein
MYDEEELEAETVLESVEEILAAQIAAAKAAGKEYQGKV